MSNLNDGQPGAENLMAEVHGYSRELSDGRTIFLGKAKGTDHYFVKFKNSDFETHLRMTPASFEALIRLKDLLDLRNQQTKVIMELAWRAIPPDTVVQSTPEKRP